MKCTAVRFRCSTSNDISSGSCAAAIAIHQHGGVVFVLCSVPGGGISTPGLERREGKGEQKSLVSKQRHETIPQVATTHANLPRAEKIERNVATGELNLTHSAALPSRREQRSTWTNKS